MSNADHATEIGSLVDCYGYCVQRGLAGAGVALRWKARELGRAAG